MTTASTSYYGGGVAIEPPFTVAVDGPRVLDVTPASDAQVVTLPDAHLLAQGWRRFILINSHASYTVDIRCNDGSTEIAGVTQVGSRSAVEVSLLDNATANGTWVGVEMSSAVAVGDALEATRFPMVFSIRDSRNSITLSRLCRQRFPAWNPATPAAIVLTVESDVVIGSTSTGVAAIYTGWFAAGSTLLLINKGVITGKGGAGGRGGDGGSGLLSTAGSAGGPALRLLIDTSIANYGTIQGGGGGGGGGAKSGSYGGGGGGGGGGYQSAVGGNGGTGGGQKGENGLLQRGGAGGPGAGAAHTGGNGGDPGAAGAAGDGGAGAAGAIDQRWSTKTLTWIRNGTRYGSETTF